VGVQGTPRSQDVRCTHGWQCTLDARGPSPCPSPTELDHGLRLGARNSSTELGLPGSTSKRPSSLATSLTLSPLRGRPACRRKKEASCPSQGRERSPLPEMRCHRERRSDGHITQRSRVEAACQWLLPSGSITQTRASKLLELRRPPCYAGDVSVPTRGLLRTRDAPRSMTAPSLVRRPTLLPGH